MTCDAHEKQLIYEIRMVRKKDECTSFDIHFIGEILSLLNSFGKDHIKNLN